MMKKIISAIVMIALAISITTVMAEQAVNAATSTSPTAQERCLSNLQQHIAAGGSQGQYVSSIIKSTCGGSTG